MQINFRHMKYIIYFGLMLAFVSCQKENLSFEITNPANFKRYDEPVFIDINKLPDDITAATYACFVGEKEIASQLIDKDGDGTKDALFLLLDLMPEETIKLLIKKVDKKSDYKTRANVRFGKRKPPYDEINSYQRVKTNDSIKASALFLMEGPAWENDRVAFRNYYDERNGIDIFGKRVETMVLDSVGIDGTNYHKLSDWGMDILHVGKSLGAGAIALQVGNTIYPIRDLQNSQYKLIEDGPLYASLKLIHNNVLIAGRKYNIVQLISIYGGEPYYISDVYISGMKGDEKFVTGIVNTHSDQLSKGDIGSQMIFSTYAPQAEDKKNLGLAIMIDKNDFDSVVRDSFPTKGIEQTYMISMNLTKDKPVNYRFYAAWETGFSSFRNENYYTSFLKREAEKKSTPLLVK